MNEEFKIEKGIPIPSRYQQRGKYISILRKMAHGDSIIIENYHVNSFRAAARNHFNITIRKVDSETHRLWILDTIPAQKPEKYGRAYK